jgi:shikimate dehydrogenase
LLGAGGAARALAVELALAGASSITVVNRALGRGAELVRLINDQTPANAELVVWDKTYQVKEGAEIVINVTSVGLYPDVDPRLNIDVNSLKPEMVIADIVPSPPRTNLIKDAEARGCKTVDGLGMLVNQAVISIKYWSGIEVDAGVMRRKLEEIYG